MYLSHSSHYFTIITQKAAESSPHSRTSGIGRHSKNRVDREARAHAERHQAHTHTTPDVEPKKKSARKVKREAARAKKCAKRCANGNQKACDRCKKEEELIAEFLDMYDDEDIDIISSFLYDSYAYGDEEDSYDNESEDSEDYYYYSYN